MLARTRDAVSDRLRSPPGARRIKCLAILLAVLWSAAVGPAVAAEICAARNIRVLIGFPPGGETDFLVRLIAPALGASLHRPIVIENYPGAGGNIATYIAARASPDGCTLLAVSSSFAGNVYLYPKPRYDPLVNFTPIARIATAHNVLVVHPSLPLHTVADLVDYAKERPGQLAFGNGGNGSTSHLAMELLRMRVGGLNVLEVPYKGVRPAVFDLLAGEIDAAVATAPVVVPHIRNGSLRPLAVASSRRVASLPDVPTFEQSGFPGFEVMSWDGIVAPAGISYDKTVRLNLAIADILKLRKIRERFAREGVQPIGDTPDEFRSYIRSEMAKWEYVLRSERMPLD